MVELNSPKSLHGVVLNWFGAAVDTYTYSTLHWQVGTMARWGCTETGPQASGGGRTFHPHGAQIS
jgi:hypothetical protein